MVESKFSLSWDTYQNNICKGLGSLQQNGEFVDMTLAADGYHVKVHQLVMSLMSPYIKDLISSAQCPHPVIFINQVSYKTLCKILEYVYTGQVLVGKDEFPMVVQAAKALQIRGLSEMDADTPMLADEQAMSNVDLKLNDIGNNKCEPLDNNNKCEPLDDVNDSIPMDDDAGPSTEQNNSKSVHQDQLETSVAPRKPSMQFTVSNRGNLQMILNRFMYHLRYSGKNNHRRWNCVDNEMLHCKACVITLGDTVVKRVGAHKHGFHDEKILKKMSARAIFSCIGDAAHKVPDDINSNHEV